MKLLYCTIAAVLALSGCATIKTGTTQEITVINIPESGCVVNGIDIRPDSNSSFNIKRSSSDLRFVCGDKVLVVETSINPWGATSIAFVDFGIVDAITGALWDYPKEIDLSEAK